MVQTLSSYHVHSLRVAVRRVREAQMIRVVDAHGATYEPWSNGRSVGFKVTRSGRTEYVYLNPSSESDDAKSNVFVYHGTEGDAGQDGTVVYVDLFMD